MTKSSTKCAGIDTGKAYLDIAIHAASDSLRVHNDGDWTP